MVSSVGLLVLCCNSICLWTLAHSLSAESDAPPSSSSSAPLDVRVSVSVSEHFVTLSCDVTGIRAGADDHKVQFYCPVLPGDDVHCFGDCSPICTMQINGSCRVTDPILEDAGSIACEKLLGPGRGSKSVRLRVDTRQPQLAGQWRCKFRGTSSATVSLAQHLPAAPTAAAAAAADAPAEATAEHPDRPEPERSHTEPPHEARPTASSSSDRNGLGVWNPDAKKFPSDFAATQGFERDPNLAKFARTDYIIGVLTIMSVSLLLNLGFCIRCVLARHYVETRKRNQRRPLDWLGSCLCVSTVQVMLDASADVPDEAGAPSGGDAALAGGQQQRRQWGSGEPDRQQRRHLLQQPQQQPPPQQPCLYCMQADCRILYDDVARSGSSDCGSSCRGGGGSFRLAGGYEGHVGRGSLLGVPAVPEETAAATELAVEKQPQLQQQDDAASIESAVSDPSSRLELSRRMLRKADTLLREANSLLLETEPTTDQQA